MLSNVNAVLRGGKSRLRAPYDYIQDIVELHLDTYLARSSEDIKQIVIVGGCDACEVSRMQRNYPSAQFIVFEPSRRYYPPLQRRFKDCSKVVCIERAVADNPGRATFYETSLRGSGSLLKPAAAANRDYGLVLAETFEVEVVTLDGFFSQQSPPLSTIDLLWCDVQGAELKVLRGGIETLRRCRAIFLEVTCWEQTYSGAPLLKEICDWLSPMGFCPCGLGIDPLNGTGNAFFINPAQRGAFRKKL